MIDGISLVVVLYNPDFLELKEVISSYPIGVNVIFVDNSEYGFKDEIIDYISQEHRYCYIDNNNNKGIAHALNIGCLKAIERGDSWVLTLDQDSRLSDNVFDFCKKFAFDTNRTNIGIVAPNIKYYKKQIVHPEQCVENEISEEKKVITSGSFINLKAYKAVGGFNNDLFIDSVDTDFCYRLLIGGYKIIQLKNVFLDHRLGNIVERKIFCNYFICVTNHNCFRRYYIVRNTFFLIKNYKETFPKEIRELRYKLFVLFLKVLFFEDDKKNKFYYMYKGYLDFLKNKLGKIDN